MLLEGIIGVQKEVVLASARSIVLVEEVVDDLRAPGPNATILPSWTVNAIVEAPGGARHPILTAITAEITLSTKHGTR